MKNTLKLSTTILFALLLVSTARIAAQDTNFATLEPETKGWALGTINPDKFITAVSNALLSYKWQVVGNEPGKLTATLKKNNGVSVTIAIVYTESVYTINYVDSTGLFADLNKMKISHNYPRWVANVNKAIFKYYSGS
jgi:hypothetical protein